MEGVKVGGGIEWRRRRIDYKKWRKLIEQMYNKVSEDARFRTHLKLERKRRMMGSEEVSGHLRGFRGQNYSTFPYFSTFISRWVMEEYFFFLFTLYNETDDGVPKEHNWHILSFSIRSEVASTLVESPNELLKASVMLWKIIVWVSWGEGGGGWFI